MRANDRNISQHMKFVLEALPPRLLLSADVAQQDVVDAVVVDPAIEESVVVEGESDVMVLTFDTGDYSADAEGDLIKMACGGVADGEEGDLVTLSDDETLMFTCGEYTPTEDGEVVLAEDGEVVDFGGEEILYNTAIDDVKVYKDGDIAENERNLEDGEPVENLLDDPNVIFYSFGAIGGPVAAEQPAVAEQPSGEAVAAPVLPSFGAYKAAPGVFASDSDLLGQGDQTVL
jgi:hypothetical protein